MKKETIFTSTLIALFLLTLFLNSESGANIAGRYSRFLAQVFELGGPATGVFTDLSTGNIGINTDVPTAQLDVDGQIRIRGGSPAVGEVLTADANGLATWEPITGSTDNDWRVEASLHGGNNMFSNVDRVVYIGRDSELAPNPNTRFVVEGGTQLRGLATITNALINELEVDPGGELHIRSGNPGAGKVLTSDANGLATWETPAIADDGDWAVSGNDIFRNSGVVFIGTAPTAAETLTRFYVNGATELHGSVDVDGVLKSQTLSVAGTAKVGALQVNNQIMIAGGSPGVGKVLTSNADGLATWEPISVPALNDANIPDDITLANITQITNRDISDTTGTLPIARGGTGLTSAGTAGQVLTVAANGSLVWQTPSTGGGGGGGGGGNFGRAFGTCVNPSGGDITYPRGNPFVHLTQCGTVNITTINPNAKLHISGDLGYVKKTDWFGFNVEIDGVDTICGWTRQHSSPSIGAQTAVRLSWSCVGPMGDTTLSPGNHTVRLKVSTWNIPALIAITNGGVWMVEEVVAQ